LVNNRKINHTLEQFGPPLLLSVDGIFDMLAAPSPLPSGFDSPNGLDLIGIQLTCKITRIHSLKQIAASYGIFQCNDENTIPAEAPPPKYEQEDVRQGKIVPEVENSESARNEARVRVDGYRIESGFISENIVTWYYARITQTHTCRLIETLRAANGPPGRQRITGEFVYHISPETDGFTLRLNSPDRLNACQFF
jgi:hypothetical protein